MKFLYRYRKEMKFILKSLYQLALMMAPVFLLLQLFNGLSFWPKELVFPMGVSVFATILFLACFLAVRFIVTHVKSKRKLLFLFAGFGLFLAVVIVGILLLKQGWILSAIVEFIAHRRYLFSLFVIVLVSFLLYFTFLGRCSMAILLLVEMVIGGVMKISIGAVVVVLALFYILDILLLISQRTQYGAEKGQSSSKRLLPVLLVLCFVCFFFPVKEEPISWQKAVDAYHALLEAKDELLYDVYLAFQNTSAEFGVGVMGYSENNGKLSGGLAQSEITMAEIKTSYKIRNRMYLTGTVFDIYEGDGWSILPDEKMEKNDYRMNTLLHLYAFSRSKKLDLDDISQFHSIRADFNTKTLKTKSVFYPQDCLKLDSAMIDNDLSLEGNNLRAQKVLKKDQGYGIHYLEINEQSELFLQMMQSFPSTKLYYNEKDYSRMLENIELCNKDSLRRILVEAAQKTDYKQLMKYAQEQYEKELSLPEDLPKRVRTLALSLTEGKESDYDKAMAIKAYLKENYTYTTKIEKAKGDSVDYFLFESKKGYCTYFASSMTVLCRAAGIPARYVEGISYRENPEKDTWKQLQGKYAHAWSEVFLESYGYLIVDATPGYETKANVKWPAPVSETEGEKAETMQPWQVNPNAQQYLPTDAMSEHIQTKQSGETTESNRRIASQTGLIVGVLFLLCLVIWIFVRIFIRWNYRHMDYKQQMKVQMEEILDRLEQTHKQERGRGLREILSAAKQIEWKDTEIAKVDWDKLCDLYEKSRYGDYELQRRDIAYIEEVNHALKRTGTRRMF